MQGKHPWQDIHKKWFVDLLSEAVRTILTCQVWAGLDLRGIPLLSEERAEAEFHYVPWASVPVTNHLVWRHLGSVGLKGERYLLGSCPIVVGLDLNFASISDLDGITPMKAKATYGKGHSSSFSREWL